MAWSPDSAFFAYLGRNVYESSTHGWIPVEIVLMRLADRAKYVIDEYYAYTWQFPRFVDRKTLDRLNPMGIPAPPSPAAVEQK